MLSGGGTVARSKKKGKMIPVGNSGAQADKKSATVVKTARHSKTLVSRGQRHRGPPRWSCQHFRRSLSLDVSAKKRCIERLIGSCLTQLRTQKRCA